MGGYPGVGPAVEPGEEGPRQCRKCDIAWGLIGAAFGAAILLVAADLLTGGRLARLVTRTPLATVTPIRSVRDDDAG